MSDEERTANDRLLADAEREAANGKDPRMQLFAETLRQCSEKWAKGEE